MKGWQEIRTPFHQENLAGNDGLPQLQDKLSFLVHLFYFILARDPKSPLSCIVQESESWNRQIFRFYWVYFVQSYYFQSRKIAWDVTISTTDFSVMFIVWEMMNGFTTVSAVLIK